MKDFNLYPTEPNPGLYPVFMKTHLIHRSPENSQKFSGLHELTDRLVSTLLPKATSNNSFFVNEIPDHLLLDTDPQMTASVLSGLLSAVVSYTKDSCIRLTAKIYGNVILMQVKESPGLNINAVEKEVSKLQPLAERMRGSVSITSQRKKLTTITFGFPNLPL